MIAFTTKSTSPSDQDLQHRVALFVQQRQLTFGANVTVSARRGVVILKGTVPTFHQRQLLIAFARKVAGVVQVQDELEVEPAASRRVSVPACPAAQRTLLPAVSILAVAAMFVGCNRSGPPRIPTHPTTGSISFQGQPLEGAFLVLHPKGPATAEAPPATAHVQPDGTFKVSTFAAGDGAPAGEYVVTAQWQKLVKTGNDFAPGPNLLPPKYASPTTSDVTVTIVAGQNQLPPIALRR